MTVGVVTPWLDHPELWPAYREATAAADRVVVIDNGGFNEAAANLTRVHPAHPLGFAASNNYGTQFLATDIVVFLNNDVVATGDWVTRVREDVEDGALYGPSIGWQELDGVRIPYVEGWCVAATKNTWGAIGDWDAEAFPKPYWEDVDISVRAFLKGFELRKAPWPIRHLGGTTTNTTPGAWDGFHRQREVMVERIRGIAA